MTCPKCGNKNAECIIGNFWRCPGCDGAPALERKSVTIYDRVAGAVAKLCPQHRIDGHVSHRIPTTVVVGAIPVNEISAANCAWWRCELEGIRIQKCSHDARALVSYLYVTVDSFLDSVLYDLRQRTAGVRRVETFDRFPHWVTDDGQILVRQCADSDAFELRMRAIWRPA